MRETWYVLEDGTFADPNDVAPDHKGKLRNKIGVAVAMKGDIPHTSGVDVDEYKSREMSAEKPALAKDREIKATGAKKYKTR